MERVDERCVVPVAERVASVVARMPLPSSPPPPRYLGEQKRASWFHNLQLKFSKRLPCSMTPEHFEKTAKAMGQGGAGENK